MGELEIEECCLENKQSTAASSSSLSEGTGSANFKSPGVSSPATASPTNKLLSFVTFFSFELAVIRNP